MKRRLIFLVLIFLSFSSYGQIDFLKSVAREQLRIDAMDGKADSNINMGTIVINQRANGIYIDAEDHIYVVDSYNERIQIFELNYIQ